MVILINKQSLNSNYHYFSDLIIEFSMLSVKFSKTPNWNIAIERLVNEYIKSISFGDKECFSGLSPFYGKIVFVYIGENKILVKGKQIFRTSLE